MTDKNDTKNSAGVTNWTGKLMEKGDALAKRVEKDPAKAVAVGVGAIFGLAILGLPLTVAAAVASTKKGREFIKGAASQVTGHLNEAAGTGTPKREAAAPAATAAPKKAKKPRAPKATPGGQ